MALIFNDQGTDLSQFGSNFASMYSAAKSKQARLAGENKDGGSGGFLKRMLGIISKNGGSPTQAQSQAPAVDAFTLMKEDVANFGTNPMDKMYLDMGYANNYQDLLNSPVGKFSMNQNQYLLPTRKIIT